MGKRLVGTLTLLAALGVGTPAVMAFNPQHDHDDNWESRDGYEYRTYQGDHPDGWNHGKKTGWDNCGMPPGRPRSTAATPTRIRDGLITTTRALTAKCTYAAPPTTTITTMITITTNSPGRPIQDAGPLFTSPASGPQ